ncbi:MAG: hypothetical protein AAB391_01090 [Patescibacteria group bacterium]
MARTLRAQKTTVFAFGEGEAERIFLKHIRSLYAVNKTSVRVDYAGGKDVSYILEKALRVKGNLKYNHSFILLDTDREWTSPVKNKAKVKGFELVGSSPCIEGLLLTVLEPATNHANRSSSDCKRSFQSNHLNGRRSLTDGDCKRLFSRSVLDAVIPNMPILKRIIKIMEGNF